MDPAEHICQLAADGPRLAAAAAQAGWDAPAPGTQWTVRELVTHVGGVHRWAAEIVRTAASGLDGPAADAVGRGPGDDALLAWFAAGHAEVVAALRAAPASLQCATFLPASSPLAFWARRQAHETAVHRADAEAAAGWAPEFAPAFAQDGIAELLHGFAARRSNAVDVPGTLSLAATDGPSWLVVLGGERTSARESDEPGDATVAGASAQLYLWLWNRPSSVAVSGDGAVADAWRTVQVR